MTDRGNYDRLRMQVGQIVPEVPEIFDKNAVMASRTARVTYIHPEGRFYEIYFEVGRSGYTETRLFSPAEQEEGRRLGIFRARSDNLAGPPGRRSEPNGLNGFRPMSNKGKGGITFG